MNNPIFILPLLHFLLSQFIPEAVAAGEGLEQVFYCKAPGCAANVTKVFCKDELLFEGDRIKECAGHQPPNSVCQCQGRAFVSTLSGGNCEFEGKGTHIETIKCTDLDSTCVFTTDTSPLKNLHQVYIVSIVCGLIVLK